MRVPDGLWPLRNAALNSIEGLTLLHQLTSEVCDAGLRGDIVECGVFNGGSAAAIGLALKRHARRLWLYDSFQGLPPAGERDSPQAARFTGELVGDLATVRRLLMEVGMPADAVVIREGWFSETFALPVPDQVALLHVDTDWYEGVGDALRRFYDAVVDDGVIVLDDFPWWEGTRRAFYEFCVERDIAPIAHRHGLTGALYWYKGETYDLSHATRQIQPPRRRQILE